MTNRPSGDTSLRAPNPLSVLDQRSGVDRRLAEPCSDTNLERRRGPGRRRTDFLRSAEEGEMNSEQFLFIKAIDAFKKANSKTFPTWTDVLEVIRKLGYRKTMPSMVNLGDDVADWTEASDAPSGVEHCSRSCDEESAA
ncbi:MAG TPA: hypothetical protein QF800_04830 [Phycisphaerales bacterium]|jgi:hypothetical protein|nr:hypothetical protein [Phycisphaerales bacterium]